MATRGFFSLKTLLLVLIAANCAQASLPSQIFFYATIRDFMAQPCRIGAGASSTDITNFCPDDPSIKAMISNGTLSGHPDFQRRDFSGTKLFKERNGYVGSYYGKYAKFGRPFPVTLNSNPPNTASDDSAITRPFVLSDLDYGTTGIPRMVYCKGQEGYLCDYNDTTAGQSVMNETTFSFWHQDNTKYNLRVGYKQTLYQVTGTKYNFDSGDNVQDPISPGFFSPLTDYNLGGWPLSPKELEQGASKKFWFTTEIHNSFQYRGNEKFDFSGDDDVHVFINNRLAMNLGGLHAKISQSINLTTYERELGLEKGKIYQFDLFHAERQLTASNFKLETTLSSACNVINTDFRTSGRDVATGIDYRNNGTTDNADWIMIAGPGFGTFEANKTALLMKAGIQNVVSYMFFKQQQNAGSGFSFSFKFRVAGSGHGFAVLFHDRALGVQDFNGGTGPNLGIRNTDNSFAVVFDMCPGYPNCQPSISQLRMHYKTTGDRLNSVSSSTLTVYDNNVVQNWRDGKQHQVDILYHASPDWLEVYVDNSLRLVKRNFSMIEVIGGRDAYVGFSSASSNEGASMDVRISDVVMKSVKVIPQLSLPAEDTSTFPKVLVANGRDTVSFSLQTRDACSNIVGFGGLANKVQARVIATNVSDAPPSSGRRLLANATITPQIIDPNNGQYSVKFTTDILASFSVYMAFGDNCTWNGTGYTSNTNCWTINYLNAALSIPFSTSAPTVEAGVPAGLGTPALAGIGVAAGVVFVCGSFMLFVGVRIRNQWRRDKRFVDEGRRIVAEKGVAYVGDNELDALTNKLQATMHALQAERAKRLKAEDKQDTIDELLRQKGELQEMVRRLKIQQAGGDPNAPEEASGIGKRFRKSFAASRVSRGASLFNPLSGEASAPNPLFARIRKSITRPPSKSQALVINEHDV